MEKFKKSEKEITFDDFLDELAEHKEKLLRGEVLISVIALNFIALIFVIWFGLK